MLKLWGTKKRLTIDLIFALILGLLYWGFHSKLPGLESEVNKLFIASYLLLGLGVLIFYLSAEMNPRFASITHTGLFPFSALIFTFVKWTPVAITQPQLTGGESALSTGLLAYVLMMIAYFNIQLFIHRKKSRKDETERSEDIFQ